MASGTARREGVQDNLLGRGDTQPVQVNGPSITAGSVPTAPNVSTQASVAKAFAKWGSSKLDQAVQVKNKRDFMEGQMAHQQGQAVDSAEVRGNKFALDGYRVMEAQTLSSSLMQAQRQEIAQGGYEASPDEFRTNYANRMDAMLDGVDPRTAELVQQQMLKQMPTLVGDHTAQHLQWKEGKNFETLENSIDVISRDPSATAELISFAQGGEGSASFGLSDERRGAAVVSGVVRAFENDNPLAYSALAHAGLLGDNLTTQQIGQLRSARKSFESRIKSEYNEGLFNGQQALMSSVEAGDLTPSQAVEELAVLYAEHDVSMTSAEAGAIYSGAETGRSIGRQTRGALLEEAALRGDLDAQANIIMDSLIVTESRGVSEAFRTNDDGRSFGGLVQMGQARLDDWSNATGGARITPASYARLPAQQQKDIARWHFKDLIKAAKATGAINSTINGTTVTLSGLVAVGHIGGGPGMRKFVRTNGAYNPDDGQAVDGRKGKGTKLSDYLRIHGSGQMDELMSPQRRLAMAEQRLVDTRDRVAMNTYEQMQPLISDLDTQYETGVINEADWRTKSDALYAEFNKARAKVDVDREIGVHEGVQADVMKERQALIEDNAAEQYINRMDDANVALMESRAAYETVINDPAATPGDYQQATAAFRESRAQVFSEYGIEPKDQNNSAADNKMFTALSEAMDRSFKYQREASRIQVATTNGGISELPADLRSRAFTQAKDEINGRYDDEVRAGRMTGEQAVRGKTAEMNAFYAKAGAVDPELAMIASNAVMGPMIDKDGNPSPEIVDAMQQYASIREMNPRAAATMFNPEASVRADAIMSRAVRPGLIGEAVRNVGADLNNTPSVADVTSFMTQPDTQREIGRESNAFLSRSDRGWFMSMATENSVNRPNDTALDLVTSEVEREVSRAKRIQPGLKTSDLVQGAVDRVSRKGAMVAGGFVMTNVDLGTEFFGGRANDFHGEMAVNDAINEWLTTDEAREQYPFLNDTTVAEWLPDVIQDGVGVVADGVRTVLDVLPFGIGNNIPLDFDPAISRNEAIATKLRGVRPFRAIPTSDGKSIAVIVMMPNGNESQSIIIPSREAGELYIQKRARKLAE